MISTVQALSTALGVRPSLSANRQSHRSTSDGPGQTGCRFGNRTSQRTGPNCDGLGD
jgi:hypothetical protein